MQIWKVVRRIIFIVRIALLVLLFAFFLTPLLRQPLTTLNNAGIQRARSERIAKDALILEYQPDQRIQAISELQDTLPLWQQEQMDLSYFPDNQVQLLQLQSNADYVAMTKAAQVILANLNKPTDPVQVAIIVAHEHDYETVINQIYTLMQKDIALQSIQFVAIELIIVILSIVLTIASRQKKKKEVETHANGIEQRPDAI